MKTNNNHLLICFVLILVLSVHAHAQQIMLNGKITYERKYSLLKDLEEQNKDEEDNVWFEQMKKNLPKYKIDLFELTFSKKQAVYNTLQEDENPMLRWYKTITEVSQKTVFDSDSTWANRTVYDKTYLIADSISKPIWKLTGEYREIAGHTCRRATTILYDSVYVIAFYTDAIPVSGGPEFFSGLPGMVLGVVIPRMHTTIFATKVNTAVLTEADFVFKSKKKAVKVNREGYRNDLSSNTEQWGKYGNRFVLKALF
ncbi:MAG: GLPGLI family protein [Bacteroidia bacterium]